MREIVLRVEHLWKEYRLGQIGQGTLYRDLQSGWARFRGKEDPNAQINLSTRNTVNRTTDRFWALQDLSFDVHRGEVIGIIGRNGAGKSTLLKILSRVTAPTKGSIKVKGRVASLLEVGTGFHPELTGRENIFLNGAILGMRHEEIEQKFDEIVKFSEIHKFIDTPVKRYSSGMYVRLAFAVAANLDPDILVIDEVLAVGDLEFQNKCLGKMDALAKGGKTVLVVSHNMGLIRNLCERVLLMNNGTLVRDDKADPVVSDYLNLHITNNSKIQMKKIKECMEGIIRKEDPIIRIYEVSLEDCNKVSKNSFFSDDDICLSIKFSTYKFTTNIIAKIILESENDESILTTQTIDDLDTITRFSKLSAGNYSARCTFPANIFGHRHFYITIHLICPHMEHLILKKIIKFEIIFKPYTPMIYGSDRDSFMRPLLKWDMTTLV